MNTDRTRAPRRAGACCRAEPLESRTLFATVPTGFHDQAYAVSIPSPTSMEFAPDGRLFVTQQTGQLRVVTRSAQGFGTLLPAPFLTVPTDSQGERGLLSVTFDPDFMSNGHLYVYYTATSPAVHNRISRFTAVDADPDPAVYRPGNTAVPGSEMVLMDLDNLSSATNHNGGAMHFGADGKLYVAVGDNANGANAQTLANRHGKMLRINPDGTIPADNPFVAQASGEDDAIWALGLRNPYTFAVQPGTGRIYINDVGQSGSTRREEINEGIAGANYGWPGIEGYRTTQPLPTIGTYRDPAHAYDPSLGGNAITGGVFYNPAVPNFPEQFVGRYFFADFGGGFIRSIDPADSRAASLGFATGAGLPVDLDLGPEGGLYYLHRGNGGGVGRIRHRSTLVPRIEAQPESRTVNEGEPATFTVVAAGEGLLGYQWRRDGENIPGATGASYTLASAAAGDSGARFSVVVTNAFGSATSDDAVLTVATPAPSVAGRHLFYNNSAYDAFDPAATAADDNAIAADKAALLPGQTASFSNLSGYARGINGLMVDIAHLPGTVVVNGDNFAFHTRAGEEWVDAPAPAAVVMRRGAGADGSDRVTVTWADGSIVNRWLRVTFTPQPDLAAPINQDVFYFGSLRGETGDPPNPGATGMAVTVIDAIGTRNARTAAAAITNRFDHNRDGRVNAIDIATVGRTRGTTVPIFTAPPPPAAPSPALRLAGDDDVLA